MAAVGAGHAARPPGPRTPGIGSWAECPLPLLAAPGLLGLDVLLRPLLPLERMRGRHPGGVLALRVGTVTALGEPAGPGQPDGEPPEAELALAPGPLEGPRPLGERQGQAAD